MGKLRRVRRPRRRSESGSIDLSGITESDGQLKNGLTGFDYEMVTKDTWDVLKRRHGGSGSMSAKPSTRTWGISSRLLDASHPGGAPPTSDPGSLKIFAHETLPSSRKACTALKVDAASAQLCEDILDETQDEPEDMEQTLARVPVVGNAEFVIVTESDLRKKPKASPPDEQGVRPKTLDSMANAFSAANLRDAARSVGSFRPAAAGVRNRAGCSGATIIF